MTRARRLFRIGLAIGIGLALLSGCTRIYNDRSTSPTGPTAIPTTPAITFDKVEYRVFGSTGNAPVTIKYSNTVDGVTVLTAASLPYVATVQSSDDSVFLYLEGSSLSLLTTSLGTLQVQIFVNGKLFREGFASGLTTLLATASGTYRR